MAVRHSIGRTEAKKKSPPSSMNPSLKPNSIRRTPPASPLQPQLDPISSPLNNKLKPQYYTQKPLVSSDPIHTHTHSLTKSLSLSSSTDPSFLLKPNPQQQQKQSQPRKQISLMMKKLNPKKEKSKPNKDSREEKPVMEEFEDLEKKRPPAVMEVVVEEEEIDQRRLSNVSLVSVGGRRKSFCDSKIELKEFFAMASARIVVVDMLPFMQIHAVSCVRKTHDSLEKPSPKILACTLKKEFDGVYGPAWHCIVGTSFGSFVTHSVGGFLYFSIDHKLYFLLFKTTVQKAD